MHLESALLYERLESLLHLILIGCQRVKSDESLPPESFRSICNCPLSKSDLFSLTDVENGQLSAERFGAKCCFRSFPRNALPWSTSIHFYRSLLLPKQRMTIITIGVASKYKIACFQRVKMEPEPAICSFSTSSADISSHSRCWRFLAMVHIARFDAS